GALYRWEREKIRATGKFPANQTRFLPATLCPSFNAEGVISLRVKFLHKRGPKLLSENGRRCWRDGDEAKRSKGGGDKGEEEGTIFEQSRQLTIEETKQKFNILGLQKMAD
ncbi:hypothetical protein AMTR_s00006p00268410, partial [Amborella trichopoda]